MCVYVKYACDYGSNYNNYDYYNYTEQLPLFFVIFLNAYV